jgi:creatinine amidohydrolase
MHYEEMLPYQIDEVMREKPIAYLPWGALEWHGKHLAIGNDALKAHALCLGAAKRSGGVVLPPVWVGFETLGLRGFPHTLEFSEDVVRQLASEYLTQLDKNGFKVIVLVTGHYGSPHVNALKSVAERVGRRTKARIWVLPEYELTKEDIGYRGDHAAKWETSLLMHLRPELVDMSQQPTDPQAKLEGVGGEDPRFHASPELGRTAAEAIEERLAKQALALLAEAE